MTDFSGFVLEQSVDRSWDCFETWLRTALGAMKDGDTVVISRESASRDRVRAHQPQVQFTAYGEGLVRGEASSNRQLDRHFWLSDEQIDQLVEIGYELPSTPADALATSRSTSFSIDGDTSYLPILATVSVRALREVFGVLHPAFLAIGGDVEQPFDTASIEPPPVPASAFPLTSEGLPASGTLARNWGLAQAGPIAMPDSPAHLRQLIEQSLIPILDRRPLVDEDGDFVIPWDGALVFVRVVDVAPVIAVFSQLAHGIADPAITARQVADLNASVEMVKFFLVDDRIVAGCTLPANPFVGEHLRELLALVGNVVSDYQQPLSMFAGEGPAFPA